MLSYARYPNNKHFHKVILEKSRKFIKDKAQNNYRQLGKVYNYLEDESKKIIEEGKSVNYLRSRKEKSAIRALVQSEEKYPLFFIFDYEPKVKKEGDPKFA